MIDRIPPVIVGAYAAAGRTLSERDEAHLVDTILSSSDVHGLEVPLGTDLSPRGDDWLLSHLARDSILVITLITETVARHGAFPSFGLASTDRRGRNSALEFARRAHEKVELVTERRGSGAVRAVEVHSAPSIARGSSESAFRDSLAEMASWDWHGAELLVEHCDRGRGRTTVAKGFLSLEEEMDAVAAVAGTTATPLGIVVNWGRSAIEGQDSGTPVEHVRIADESGLLRAVVFSGCSNQPGARGGPWADVHLPPCAGEAGDPLSLMTDDAVAATIDAIEDPSLLAYLGIKVSCPHETPLARRIQIVENSVDRLTHSRGASDIHKMDAPFTFRAKPRVDQ